MKWDNVFIAGPGNVLDRVSKGIFCHIDHEILTIIYLPLTRWTWNFREELGMVANEVE